MSEEVLTGDEHAEVRTEGTLHSQGHSASQAGENGTPSTYPAPEDVYAPSDRIFRMTWALNIDRKPPSLGGSRVLMIKFATASSAAMTAPLVRTPFANPMAGLEKRWLSIMGKTIPPQDAPETAIPVASARRARKWCEMMLSEGMKRRPTASPTPTPCDRKT